MPAMMEMRFWEDNSLPHVKYESNSNDNIPTARESSTFYCEAANLNFATANGDDDHCIDYATYRNGAPKSSAHHHQPHSHAPHPTNAQNLHHQHQQHGGGGAGHHARVSRQDPLSHRIIEKRRRDRMNNCLADLSRLIPAEYLKKGRGRVEKTEIIEMAIKHMKHLQYMNHYRAGYQDCMAEVMRFMVEVEGHFARDAVCVRLLDHLQQHCDVLCRGDAMLQQQQQHQQQQQQEHHTEVNGDGGEEGKEITPKLEPNNNYEHNSDGNEHDFEMMSSSGGHEEDHHALLLHDEGKRGEEHEHHSGYKYKNDIKLRFTQDNQNSKKPKLADRRNSTPISTDNQTSSSLGSPQYNMDTHTSSLRPHDVDSVTQWTLASVPPVPPDGHYRKMLNANGTSSAGAKLNFLVPAFVLHTKGAFYVPLSLDYQTLLPYLSHPDMLVGALNNDNIALHPVSINVNFHQQQQQQQQNAHQNQCNGAAHNVNENQPLNLQQEKKLFEKLPS